MAKHSAGILLFRRKPNAIEVLLVHPGGPFWRHKDHASWSIPKGEVMPCESLFSAALRELREETAIEVSGDFIELQPVKQPSGKVIHAWAVEADCDPKSIQSNTFSIELPRGSGHKVEFPEVDRMEWFSITVALWKILKGQIAILEELQGILQKSGEF